MLIGDLALIECRVVFLTPEEGGRAYPFPPGALRRCHYRPHVVVGDPSQREAVLDEDGNGAEEYLGVCFESAPESVRAGELFVATLRLMYFPCAGYDALAEGATFTIREGGKIVGWGEVTHGLAST